MDEYSSRGTVQAPTKVADYGLKIQSLVNDALSDLANTSAKLPAVFEIAHYPIKNTLSDDTSTPKQFIPGNGDFSISLTNAKSVYWECIGPGTVIIEETADGTNYTEIEEITVPSTVTGFTAYRRLITPSVSTNTVRLRFTGDYLYLFRNYVLYPISFPSEEAVQQHSDWVMYDMPTDFFKLNFVEAKKPTRQYQNYTTYRFRPDKKIFINSYDAPLDVLCHYWRKPTLLTYSGVTATDDLLVVDVLDDASARVIPYFCAGQVLISEGNTGNGTLLLNIYESRKSNFIVDIGVNSGISNVYNW